VNPPEILPVESLTERKHLCCYTCWSTGEQEFADWKAYQRLNERTMMFCCIAGVGILQLWLQVVHQEIHKGSCP
jgi:hypothetical protein